MLSQLTWRADRISSLSLLTLVHRSLPPAEYSGSSFSEECLNSARMALEEHQKCLSLADGQGSEVKFLDLFIDWCDKYSGMWGESRANNLHRSMLHSPFVPFTILFCHIIESSSEDDLQALGAFLERGEGTTYTSRHASTRNQLRLFQELYNVAVRYTKIKKASSTDEAGFTGIDGQDFTTQQAGSLSGEFGADAIDFGAASSAFQPPVTMETHSQQQAADFAASLGLQADSSGSGLASWFASNQQLMRMMENT